MGVPTSGVDVFDESMAESNLREVFIGVSGLKARFVSGGVERSPVSLWRENSDNVEEAADGTVSSSA